MNGREKAVFSRSAVTRVMMSAIPPATNGTTTRHRSLRPVRTGRDDQEPEDTRRQRPNVGMERPLAGLATLPKGFETGAVPRLAAAIFRNKDGAYGMSRAASGGGCTSLAGRKRACAAITRGNVMQLLRLAYLGYGKSQTDHGSASFFGQWPVRATPDRDDPHRRINPSEAPWTLSRPVFAEWSGLVRVTFFVNCVIRRRANSPV